MKNKIQLLNRKQRANLLSILMICFLLPATITVCAQTSGSTSGYKQIQNRYKPDQYLHNQNGRIEVGSLGAPGWWSAQWEFIDVPNTGYVQIRNRYKPDQYLHNENGRIEVGRLGAPGWWSAQWKLINVPGTGYVQIQNRYKPDQYLHNENGRIEVGRLGAPGWWSAQWKLIDVNVAPAPSRLPDQLRNGQTLKTDERLISHNGEYQAIMQGDGNFVVYCCGGKDVWSSKTVGKGGVSLNMQVDGNLVMRDANGKAIWASNTDGKGASALQLTSDGQLIIYVQKTGEASFVTPRSPYNPANYHYKTTIPLSNTDCLDGSAYFTGTQTESWLKEYAKGWMGKIPGNTKMSEISIPGTHDSGATILGDAFECQSMSIKEQLESGIRAFDIRISCGDIALKAAEKVAESTVPIATKKFSEPLYIYHGIGYMGLTFEQVLEDMKQFLKENPTEAIIMLLSCSGYGIPKTCVDYEKTRKEYIQHYQSIFYSGTNTNPELDDLRGKIYDWDKMGVTDFERQNDYEVTFASSTEKQQQVKDFFEKSLKNTSEKWFWNHTHGAKGMMPYDCAKHVNPVVYDYLGHHVAKRKLGIVMMDFPGSKLIYRIIQTNFANQVIPEVPDGVRHYVITLWHIANYATGDDEAKDLEIFGDVYSEPSEKVFTTKDTNSKFFSRSESEYIVLPESDPHYLMTARQNFFVREEDITGANVKIVCRLKEHDTFDNDDFDAVSTRKLYDIPVGFYHEWPWIVDSDKEKQKVRIFYAMMRVK